MNPLSGQNVALFVLGKIFPDYFLSNKKICKVYFSRVGICFANSLKTTIMKHFTTIFISFYLIFAGFQGHSQTPALSANRFLDVEPRDSKAAKRVLVGGLKAGLNISNVYDERGADFVADPKAGFAAGAFLSIPFGGWLGFQPEALISQKGFSSTGGFGAEKYSLERTSTFLDLPLQLQIKPLHYLSFLIGFNYAYLLKQSDAITYGNNSVAQSQEFNNDNIRKNTLGAIGGFDINIRHFVIAVRTGWDLTANRGDGSSFTPQYKNYWTQACLGYRFY